MRPSLDIYIMFTHEHILWVSPLQRGSLVSPMAKNDRREGRAPPPLPRTRNEVLNGAWWNTVVKLRRTWDILSRRD